MSHKYIPKISGYTHTVCISPRFYNLKPGDERVEFSALGQIDTIYKFDTHHIRLKQFANFWENHDLSVYSADGREHKITPDDIFAPMAIAFKPIIVFSKDRRFGKVHLTTQSPNQYLSTPCRVTVPIINPAQFSLIVSTGMISYRLAYNWENRLCIY